MEKRSGMEKYMEGIPMDKWVQLMAEYCRRKDDIDEKLENARVEARAYSF